MITTKLNLHFTGLCAIVRNTNGKRARVVLVDARNGGNHHGHLHDPHYACLLVPLKYWDQSKNVRLPIDDYDNKVFGGKGVILSLEKEDIIPPKGEEPFRLEEPLVIEEGEFCPGNNAGNHTRGFGWVARISETAASGSGAILKSVLVDSNPPDVLVRVAVESGIFSARDYRRIELIGKKLILKWIYGPEDGVIPDQLPKLSAIAEEVLLYSSIGSADGLVKIESRKFGGAPGDPIILSPVQGGAEVQAWIVNMPLKEIKGDGPVEPLLPDYHYVHFYRIANDNQGGLIPIPVPKDYCDPDGGGLSNPKCPPAWFDEDHEDA